jgi:hypothetical protein
MRVTKLAITVFKYGLSSILAASFGRDREAGSLWNCEDLWRMLASFRKIGYAVYGE